VYKFGVERVVGAVGDDVLAGGIQYGFGRRVCTDT
jgi:hypothetical protein